MMQDMIVIKGLTKRFARQHGYRNLLRFWQRDEITAVDDVSLTIKEGELFGLLGPNGAGKTTLVKMLCTLVLPSAGQAWVAGQDIVKAASTVRQQVGLVDTQERSFFWRLSGRQNLEFFAALHNLRGATARTRINEVLDLVGLDEHTERRFMTYSSGMRQKLAIARSMLAMPPLLIMDEPTRSLDPVSARHLRRFIRETVVEQLGRTVVLVTHHLEEAESLCDRLAIMNRGRIVACGAAAEIKQLVAARQRYHLQVAHLPHTAIAELKALPGVVHVAGRNGHSPTLDLKLTLIDEQIALPAVMRLIVAQGGAVQYCQAQPLSLEEAFMHLIKEPNRNGL